MMISEQQPTKWASVRWNEKFLCIETYSGRGRCTRDPEGAQHLLPLHVSDDALGAALQDALVKSRRLTMEEVAVFFDLKLSQLRYEVWVADMVTRYGYRTRRALFKHMRLCNVRQQDETIIMEPTRHDRLEGWAGLDRSLDEVITDTDTAEAIGAALRRAMNRCC